MSKKALTLILVLLMVSPIFTLTNETAITSTQSTPQESAAIVAETDPARVTLEANVFPNDGLEEWGNPHQPTDFSTSVSEETDTWLESTIVHEGSYSMGLEARAMDTYHSVDLEFHRQFQAIYPNIANVTLDLDWYLDSIGTPIDQDYIRIEVRLDYRNMYYYLGCETGYTNYTNNAYFEIAGPLQTWNHLHRNLTADYLERFSELPSEFTTLEWQIRTNTPLEYTRVFLDDLNILNGTIPIFGGSTNNADFEDSDGWYAYPDGDGPGDIAQCSDSNTGSSSMNLTALTFDDRAWADVYRTPDKLLTSGNQANLSFWWKLDDYVNPSMSTFARVTVSFENTTFQSDFYYYMFVGGSGTLPLISSGNNMKFAADSFNVTDTWNFFNRNLWEDFNSVYSSENLWIDQIRFEVDNNEDGAKLSLLVDDITFAPSILNDMDYEQQNAVEQPIQGWEYPSSATDKFTVTDFAESGSKAANLTLMNGDIDLDQDIHEIPIDSTTELILDFNVYIDTFNTSSEDYVLFEFYFDEDAFSYIIANSSSAFVDDIEGEDDASFIILQDTMVTGEWLNFQLDIVHDYELIFGSLPDTIIYDLNLLAEAVAGSKLEVYFDDLYIYYDTSPEITSTDQSPTTVDEVGVPVTISAEVIDASEVEVTLSYRVDAGAWTNLTMDETTNGNYAVDINAPDGETEYFITAKDAFNKTDVAMDGGDYFTFTTVDTIDPVITLTPANGTTVSDIVTIEIEVTDAGSGFANAELFIAGVSIANLTQANIGITWDTNVIPDGDYSITVVAEDNAGNTATVTHVVTVENVGAAIDYTLVSILMAVIIIAVGAVLVIYLFVIKKR